MTIAAVQPPRDAEPGHDRAVDAWPAPGPGSWQLDLDHVVQPSSRIHQDVFPAAMAEGFAAFTARYGLPLSHFDVRYVHGWQYLRARTPNTPERAVKPPPDLVLRWLLRVDPRARRRAAEAGRAFDERRWEGDVDRWERTERDRWTERNLALQDESLGGGGLDDRGLDGGGLDGGGLDGGGLDGGGLADHVRRASRAFAEGISLHFALLGPALAVGELIAESRRWGLEPGETVRVLEGASPASSAPVEELRRVATALVAAGVDPATLDTADLDGVRAASPDAAAALDGYLRHHGGRLLTRDDVAGHTLAELPGLVLQSIRAVASGPERAPSGVDAVVDELAEGVPETERARFRLMVAGARRAYATLDDQSGVLGSWTGGLLRRSLLAAGARLQRSGAIAQRDQVFDLTVDEVAALLEGGNAPSKDEVSARAVERSQAAQAAPPRFLGTAPVPPPDPALFPLPMARMAKFMIAFLDLKLDRGASVTTTLSGTGVGTGVYRGRARVGLDAVSALECLEPGDVLVARMTTPAYNAALPVVGALVTEQGGLLGHPAVVARELGIPAVIGVAGATTLIPDGAIVDVDAGAGQVRVVSGPRGDG